DARRHLVQHLLVERVLQHDSSSSSRQAFSRFGHPTLTLTSFHFSTTAVGRWIPALSQIRSRYVYTSASSRARSGLTSSNVKSPRRSFFRRFAASPTSPASATIQSLSDQFAASFGSLDHEAP